MTKQTKTAQRKKAVVHALPLTKKNYRILGLGLLSIVLGYVALAQEPWDGVFPLYVAPLLLFAGYCILIPLGILYRGKEEKTTSVEQPAGQTEA